MAGSTESLHVVFVCTGNICRSPMAEVMVRDALTEAGLDAGVTLASAGVAGWHEGKGMDPRAADALREVGLPTEHRASELTAAEREADLLVALDSGHAQHLRDAGVAEERIRLLRSFDPGADSPDVEDPYFGDRAGFDRTRAEIAAALPGLVAALRSRLD